MNEKYIRFDWAAKRILRDKANFGVLEGFLTVLIGEKITIKQIIESEGNQGFAEDKFNRVDVMALNSKGEVIIIEIQNTREVYFLERILYGVAKAITDHIGLGDDYDRVKKVYSISILYFNIGHGKDYLYHGQNTFVGVNTGDTLMVDARDRNAIVPINPADIFPEYFLIRVNEFDKVATTPLEEWIEYLKTGQIADDTSAPGLTEAKQKLQYITMPLAERRAYERHMDNIRIQRDMIQTALLDGENAGLAKGRAEGLAEGRAEGLAEGLVQGRAEGKLEGLAEGIEEGRLREREQMVRKMKEQGATAEFIMSTTGFSEAEIAEIWGQR